MSAEEKQTHNRIHLLRTNAKAFCREHGVQRVRDYFVNETEATRSNSNAGAGGRRKREQVHSCDSWE